MMIIVMIKKCQHFQVAGAREMFLWLGSFYVLAGSAMLAGFAR